MNSHAVFIHIHQGCFAGTGAIVRLPQCQWSKPDGYGKISQCITTTKHSKAKTVCIFLWIYCIYERKLIHLISNILYNCTSHELCHGSPIVVFLICHRHLLLNWTNILQGYLGYNNLEGYCLMNYISPLLYICNIAKHKAMCIFFRKYCKLIWHHITSINQSVGWLLCSLDVWHVSLMRWQWEAIPSSMVLCHWWGKYLYKSVNRRQKHTIYNA